MKFPLGMIVFTPGAEHVMSRLGLNPLVLVQRHASGDWGDLDEHDREMNEQMLEHGGRLMSVYGAADDRLYVITEADRSVTTILTPEEY